MKLYIRNMVSTRCKMFVSQELDKLVIPYKRVELGEVYLFREVSEKKKEVLRTALLSAGLEIIEDTRAQLIDRTISTVINMVYNSDHLPRENFSDILARKVKYDYKYLSSLFMEVKGITLEHYIIQHKMERIKELLSYHDLSISEIAWKMNYSSVAHLSNQFKKMTGMAPSEFRTKGNYKRIPLSEV